MAITDTTTITSRGRITIPKSIRTELRIESGDQLQFAVTDDGELLVSRLDDPMDQLESVRTELGHLESSVDELRRESKAGWSSL